MSTHPPADPGLRVELESHLPPSLPPGCAVSVFCFGHCFAPQGVASLRLLVDGTPHPASATAMPRRDLYEWIAGTPRDPGAHSYRSGFWAVVPVRARARGSVQLAAQARTRDGALHTVPLGAIPVRAPEPVRWEGPPISPQTIVVCLATFDPDSALLAAQLDSLRAQRDPDWVCLISDGGSEPRRFEQLRELTAGDQRFVVSRAERRLGPYQNFERALARVPRQAELVALCDQDDRWYPDKLDTLRQALGPAQVVFSDQRLVDPDGHVIRDSLWRERHHAHDNLASLLVANAVPGAAMLFRRELLDLALPFPRPLGDPYHDHWLALVALATGSIAFVERPLFDWVQHGAAASGGKPSEGPRTGSRGWRGAYFGGYVLRQVQAQTLLARAEGRLSPRRRRALRWFIAAERSPLAFLWLALRPLRRLAGRDETLSGEVALVKGIVWRWLVWLGAAGAKRPGRRVWDAAFPDPPRFEQPRLRRWRTGEPSSRRAVRSARR